MLGSTRGDHDRPSCNCKLQLRGCLDSSKGEESNVHTPRLSTHNHSNKKAYVEVLTLARKPCALQCVAPARHETTTVSFTSNLKIEIENDKTNLDQTYSTSVWTASSNSCSCVNCPFSFFGCVFVRFKSSSRAFLASPSRSLKLFSVCHKDRTTRTIQKQQQQYTTLPKPTEKVLLVSERTGLSCQRKYAELPSKVQQGRRSPRHIERAKAPRYAAAHVAQSSCQSHSGV